MAKTVWTDSTGKLLIAPGGGFLASSGVNVNFIPNLVFALHVEGSNVRGVFQNVPTNASYYDVQFYGEVEGVWTTHKFRIHDPQEGSYIIGTVAEVLGPFTDNNPFTEMNVAVVDSEGNSNPVGRVVSSPIPPGTLVYDLLESATPNQFFVEILDPFPSGGDGSVLGDGLGEIEGVEIEIGGEVIDLGGISAGATLPVNGMPAGTFNVRLRVYNDNDIRGPWGSVHPIVIKDVPPAVPPVYLGTMVPETRTAGTAISINFDNYFTGADGYRINTHLDGGVSSGGARNNLYNVSSAVEGVTTLSVTAYNAGGERTATQQWTINPAPVVPVINEATFPAAIQVSVGQTINIDLSQYLSEGTTPVTWSTAQENTVLGIITGRYFRNKQLLTVPMATANWTFRASNAAGFDEIIVPVTVNAVRAAKLVVGTDVTMDRAINRFVPPTSPQEARAAVIKFPSKSGSWAQALWWSTTTPDEQGEIPESQIEVLTQTGPAGEYQPFMETGASNGVFSPSRLDYSVLYPSESTRAARFRVAYTPVGVGQIRSAWSEPMEVPQVELGIEGLPWLPVILRNTETKLGKTGLPRRIGNPGMQFERSVVWNLGKADVAKQSDIFTLQDENRSWKSEDNGATWVSVRMEGMPGAFSAGIYVNSDDKSNPDDDGLIVMVVSNGYGSSTDKAGIYVSRDWGRTAKRYNPTRTGTLRGWLNVTNGQTMRRIQNCVARRPQNAAGTLTHAQRPIYIVEQAIGNPGTTNADNIREIFLWKSLDNLDTEPTVVRELPIADFVSTTALDLGIKHITVAPNGDILICGARGAHLSIDGGVTWTSLNFANKVEMSNAVFVGGNATTVSGAYFGAYADPGGIWYTANVRTTVPTKPVGAGSVANAGLPAGFRINHFGVSPVNQQRLIATCPTSVSSRAFLSTDGGKNFTSVTSIPVVGDDNSTNSYRYNLQGSAAGIYFSPHNENFVMATTNQTITRSIDKGVTFNGNMSDFFDASDTKGDGDSATDWAHNVIMQQDRTSQISRDGLLSVEGRVNNNPLYSSAITIGGVTQSLTQWILQYGGGSDAGYASGSGIVICPNDRYILFLNRNTGSNNSVAVVWDAASGQPGQPKDIGTSRTLRQFRHPLNNDIVFIGRWAISNLGAATQAGIVFTDHMVSSVQKEILGYCLVGTTLHTYWTDRTSSVTQVFKSTASNGSNLVSVFSGLGAFNPYAAAVDPFNVDTIYYSRAGEKHIIRKLQKVGSTVTDVVLFNLRTAVQDLADANRNDGGSSYIPTSAVIRQIEADYNMPGLFYATYACHGSPFIWMSQDYCQTWTNINGNIPLCPGRMWINKLTGNLRVESSMGTWVRAVPPNYPAMPHRNKHYLAQRDWYNQDDLPNPPVA